MFRRVAGRTVIAVATFVVLALPFSFAFVGLGIEVVFGLRELAWKNPIVISVVSAVALVALIVGHRLVERSGDRGVQTVP